MELPLLTSRLRLRALREDDLDGIHRIYTHPRVAALIGPHDRAEIGEEIGFHIAHQASHGFSLWAVELRESGLLVGDCGLQPLELRGPAIELSYDLHPDFWGRGLATEAARATVDTGFRLDVAERIVAVVKPTHQASRAVLERTGLTLVGPIEAYGEQLLCYELRRCRAVRSCARQASPPRGRPLRRR